MADTNITELKYLVAPDVLPCPDPIVNREVVSVILEFCKKTNILQRDFELDVDSNDIDTDMQNCIDFDISEFSRNLRPVAVLEIMIDSTKYVPHKRNIQSTITNWETQEDDNVKYFWFPNDHTIRVFDMDSGMSNIWFNISVKPLRTATTIDTELFEDWSEALVAGAKAKILAMPGKEWSDGGGAQYYMGQYRKYTSQAKAQVMRGATGVYDQTVRWKSFEY